MQARAKYASDTKAVVEANLAITQDSETLLMKYEDLRRWAVLIVRFVSGTNVLIFGNQQCLASRLS